MDFVEAAARHALDRYFAERFGLPVETLRHPGVSVVPALPGETGITLFLLGPACVVVTIATEVDAVTATLAGLTPAEVFTPTVARHLAGGGAEIHGPSWHGYVTEATFRGRPSAGVDRLDPADPRLRDLRSACDLADWREGGFPVDPSSVEPNTIEFYGIVDRDQLVAAGNMTPWRGAHADVGLITRPDSRGLGLATRIAATMTAASLPGAGIVRYRALVTNKPSLAIASRLGFDGYGFNMFARRPTD